MHLKTWLEFNRGIEARGTSSDDDGDGLKW